MITGPAPGPNGLALVVWGGGSLTDLNNAALNSGCDSLRSVWAAPASAGRLVGYLYGAPAAVNRQFLDAYGNNLPADLPVILACGVGSAEPRDVALAPALGDRRFDSPVEVGAYPGSRMFVAEQGGRVQLASLDGSSVSTLLDISGIVLSSGSEEGLLSFALDPAFASNGYAYAYYAAPSPRRTVLARYRVANDVIAPSSALVILEVEQPYANHNGGAIRFGSDGMLYLGLGDGGSGGDPQGNGQNPGTLLGSIIRIDVRGATAARPYVVPSDNPLIPLVNARDEVWAYGLRNPWRMAWDPEFNALWVGDVGQGNIEEIDVVRAGGNYGWNRLEGNDCYAPSSGCIRTGTIAPVATYDHSKGCSVTGGVVYRGPVQSLVGWYVYADYCSGTIWGLRTNGADADGAPIVLLESGRSIVSFGTDAAGHVYVVDIGGRISRLTAN
ncbi:MAG: PQQ-dependent sugar dehydrogenase [Dehalococcoidia bacterium]